MGLIKKELKVKVTFTEELLGTLNSDPKIYETYIASKAPTTENVKEEVNAIFESVSDEDMEAPKQKIIKTIFPKIDGIPFTYDYQWKGYFKDAAKALKRAKSGESGKKEYTAYKQIIDKLIFVKPRKIPITLSGEMGSCQRPLRAQTPQGEVTALANSETVPAGSSEIFTVMLVNDEHEKWIKELLEYGQYGGTGQWRNSGKGTFTVEYLD